MSSKSHRHPSESPEKSQERERKFDVVDEGEGERGPRIVQPWIHDGTVSPLAGYMYIYIYICDHIYIYI